jgi:hypothetical protein
MPKVSLQFHADPDELLALTGVWAEEEGYVRTAEQFFPYRAVVAGREAATASELGIDRVDRIALTTEPPMLPSSNEAEDARFGGDALLVTFGKCTEDGLRQSALGGITDDRDVAQRWRSLVARSKKAMHKGAVLRNPLTGATKHGTQHLHTPGAHELARRGVKMLAAAGWNEYEFDDVSEQGA